MGRHLWALCEACRSAEFSDGHVVCGGSVLPLPSRTRYRAAGLGSFVREWLRDNRRAGVSYDGQRGDKLLCRQIAWLFVCLEGRRPMNLRRLHFRFSFHIRGTYRYAGFSTRKRSRGR